MDLSGIFMPTSECVMKDAMVCEASPSQSTSWRFHPCNSPGVRVSGADERRLRAMNAGYWSSG